MNEIDVEYNSEGYPNGLYSGNSDIDYTKETPINYRLLLTPYLNYIMEGNENPETD